MISCRWAVASARRAIRRWVCAASRARRRRRNAVAASSGERQSCTSAQNGERPLQRIQAEIFPFADGTALSAILALHVRAFATGVICRFDDLAPQLSGGLYVIYWYRGT